MSSGNTTTTITNHLISEKTTPYNNQQKKKRIFKIIDFADPADHRLKLKECEKKDKYLDFARELKKKLGNMRVTIVWIVTGAFGTVTKGLLRAWRSWKLSESIIVNGQNIGKSPGGLRRLAVTQTPVKKTSANADAKNFKGVNDNNNNRLHDKGGNI